MLEATTSAGKALKPRPVRCKTSVTSRRHTPLHTPQQHRGARASYPTAKAALPRRLFASNDSDEDRAGSSRRAHEEELRHHSDWLQQQSADVIHRKEQQWGIRFRADPPEDLYPFPHNMATCTDAPLPSAPPPSSSGTPNPEIFL